MTMNGVKTSIVFGATVEQGRFVPTRELPWIAFRDAKNGSTFFLGESCTSRHLLLLGSSGSGKTNVMNMMLGQLRRPPVSDQSAYIVFDTKGDYLSHDGFFRPGDAIVGNGRTVRSRAKPWNIFDEVTADGLGCEDVESNAREISSMLFNDRGSKTQPFFAYAARDVFASSLIYFVRRSIENPEAYRGQLNNATLKNMLVRCSAQELTKLFSRYDDMAGLKSYFGDGKNTQGLGVLGELKAMVYDCFQGGFAKACGDGEGFSARRFVRNDGGRALFLEYDLSLGLTLRPVYQAIVDLALKEQLSSGGPGRLIAVLDELMLLPRITHLSDALNFGRSRGVSVIAGLQSVSQIEESYGELSDAILGGFGSLVGMRSTDASTREYISRRFGLNGSAFRYQDRNGTPVEGFREGHVVEDWTLQSLKVGEAVVGLSSQEGPFTFTFEREGDKR